MNSKELVNEMDKLASEIKSLEASTRMIQRSTLDSLTTRIYADGSFFNLNIDRGEAMDRVSYALQAAQDKLSRLSELKTAMDIIAASYKD